MHAIKRLAAITQPTQTSTIKKQVIQICIFFKKNVTNLKHPTFKKSVSIESHIEIIGKI